MVHTKQADVLVRSMAGSAPDRRTKHLAAVNGGGSTRSDGADGSDRAAR